MISIIVAMDPEGVIGDKQKIPWQIKSEIKHFKEITEGHVVIFGRQTWDSLPKKPLSNRTNIIITNSRNQWDSPDALIRGDIYSALTYCHICQPDKHIFICGGSKLYRECLPFVDRIYLSLLNNHYKGDTYFPCEPHQLMYGGDFVITREESRGNDSDPWDFYLLERESTL